MLIWSHPELLKCMTATFTSSEYMVIDLLLKNLKGKPQAWNTVTEICKRKKKFKKNTLV